MKFRVSISALDGAVFVVAEYFVRQNYFLLGRMVLTTHICYQHILYLYQIGLTIILMY